jgi:Choline dehydrogenase and related flavoproteins
MNDQVTGKFRWGPANRNRPPWQRIGGTTWQNSGVGGSTLHYFGNSPRAFPQVIDNIWPISYNELTPYYERVEAALPVNTAPVTAKEEIFYYGAKNAGWKYAPINDYTAPAYRPQPNAILRTNPSITNPNFDFNTNKSVGCTLRGHCINGCHIGPTIESVAKRTTLVSYIPKALNTGNIEIRPNTFVTKILTEEDTTDGLRAVGVISRDTWTGDYHEFHAKIIVMSAGGIETPRLWLNSGLPENPWVGKGLTNHYFDALTGIFDEAALMKVLGVSDIKPFVGQNSAARFDYPGLGVIITVGLTPALQSSTYYASGSGFATKRTASDTVPWDYEGAVIGEQLKEYMRVYTRTLNLTIFTDDEVRQENGITLHPELKDENGYLPVIQYHPSAADTTKRDKLAVIAAQILKAAGAKTIIRGNWSPEVYIHIMSTMRMGYVTDTNCEALQVKRLYIADNSVLFNGLGGPNPTLTTQALATRTADKIDEKYFNKTT